MKKKRSIRTRLILLVLCAGVFVSGSRATVRAAVNPDGSVAISEENFPCQDFRHYLTVKYDKNSNAILEKNELDAVFHLSTGYDSEDYEYDHGELIWKQGAYDLRGIENFYNLESICISDISNLTGTIPALPRLKEITIEQDHSCYRLNFSVLKQKLPLARIQSFSISHPTLGTVDLSALEKMERFSMKVPVARHGDVLYDERCIYKGALDFRKNKEIKEIHIENSNLTKLNVSANTELNRLELVRTNVKNLDLSKNKKLRELYIGQGSGVTFRLPAKNCLERIEVNMAGGSLDLTSCTGSLKEISNATFDKKGVVKVCMKRSVLKKLLKKEALLVGGEKLKKSQVKFPKKGKYAYFKM